MGGSSVLRACLRSHQLKVHSSSRWGAAVGEESSPPSSLSTSSHPAEPGCWISPARELGSNPGVYDETTMLLRQSVHLTIRQRSVVTHHPGYLSSCNTGRAWAGVCLYFQPLISPHLTSQFLTVSREFPGFRFIRCYDWGWEVESRSSVHYWDILGTWENLSKKNFQTLVNFQQRCEDQHNPFFFKKRQ